MLLESQWLVHYDPRKPLKLATDASAYGLGAVISHILEDGSERPIAFASRTCCIRICESSEKNYSQLHKEALAIILGVKKFHQYLYGCKFTLETDHEPLVTIFGPKTGVPTLAAARLQRWAIILSAYQYEIGYRCSAKHANADVLSRLPLESISPAIGEEAEIFQESYFDELPVTAKQIETLFCHAYWNLP